jgi:hypothetical protein
LKLYLITILSIIFEKQTRNNNGPITQNCLGPTDILESANNAALNTYDKK